jgi:hypothetical protein
MGSRSAIYSYIKDAGNLLGLIYRQHTQSNDFWIGAATRTIFLTIRHTAEPISAYLSGIDGILLAPVANAPADRRSEDAPSFCLQEVQEFQEPSS